MCVSREDESWSEEYEEAGVTGDDAGDDGGEEVGESVSVNGDTEDEDDNDDTRVVFSSSLIVIIEKSKIENTDVQHATLCIFIRWYTHR